MDLPNITHLLTRLRLAVEAGVPSRTWTSTNSRVPQKRSRTEPALAWATDNRAKSASRARSAGSSARIGAAGSTMPIRLFTQRYRQPDCRRCCFRRARPVVEVKVHEIEVLLQLTERLEIFGSSNPCISIASCGIDASSSFGAARSDSHSPPSMSILMIIRRSVSPFL